ncbi:hypothetical protein FSP39_014097 [Pinctada imbricata]|uniref:Uncharacterized protein n=1 Tax=Pinctada imbricata TaxID=66713 RepID=A0AA88YR87_PINIB|nr:hypothetical protein FSP39_014097 [Pinctada imbricata]
MDCCVNCCNTTNNNNITEEELQEKLDKIRAILLVNKHNLSSTIRKRVSATDERVSSKGIGGAGAVILCTLVISIVAIDINSLVKMLLSNKKK